MYRKLLILLSIVLVGLSPCEGRVLHIGFRVPVDETEVTTSRIQSDTGDRPQWADIGMHDVLAPLGGATLTPPSAARVVVHHASSSDFRIPHFDFGMRLSAVAAVTCPRCGYIYLLRCLRL